MRVSAAGLLLDPERYMNPDPPELVREEIEGLAAPMVVPIRLVLLGLRLSVPRLTIDAFSWHY